MNFIEMIEFVLNYLIPNFEYDLIEDDYCYCNHEDNVIAMNYEDAVYNESAFIEFAESIYPKAREFSVVLWSLLHECGHSSEEDVDLNDMFLRAMLNITDISESVSATYFRLPREREATTWAANFISENYEKCKTANDIINDWIERNM